MEVKITTTIEKTLYGTTEENQANIQKHQDIQVGGSIDKFETPSPYDLTTELVNDFTIKDAQTFEFDLDKANTFNKDILTLINTPVADVTFLHIFCVETENVQTLLPIKFKLTAEINGAGGNVELGEMTSFTLSNIKTTKFTKLFVSEIIVPDKMKALLAITIGSRNKNI